MPLGMTYLGKKSYTIVEILNDDEALAEIDGLGLCKMKMVKRFKA